jgi:zinc transport system substrate-binding protein
MLKKLVFIVTALLSMNAAAVQVVSSIKPIQLIVAEITEGAAKSQVLLGANASPHDYALKPSDVRTLDGADLVVWFGSDLEPYIASLMQGKDNSFEISKLKGVEFREYQDADAHDGHNHGSTDAHFWLGVTPSLQVAKALSEKLALLDENNAEIYQQNFQRFEQQLRETEVIIAEQLKPVSDKGYYVFHDAYGYFESHFGLSQLGHFTISPERKPGARTLIAIRTALKEQPVACVFQEPQFTPAVIESVTRGSDVSIGTLDPLATEVELESGAYFLFLQQISQSFADCLDGSLAQ